MGKALNTLLCLGVCGGLTGCSTFSKLNYFGSNPSSVKTNEIVYVYSDIMEGTQVIYDSLTLKPTGLETNKVVFPRAVRYENPETVDKAQSLFNTYNRTLGKNLAPIDSQEAINFVNVLDSLAGTQISDNKISSSDIDLIGPKVYKISNQAIKEEFERVTNTSQQQYRPRQDK